MSGTWILLSIILISSLPVIAVYIWFRLAKYQFSLVRFLFALLAGAAAFFPALIMQDILNFSFATGSRAAMFYHYFIRVALTEEISRLLTLSVFFWINTRIKKQNSAEPFSNNAVKEGTATGLVAGLGFAIFESSIYGASDSGVLFIRIFTAALHGACGARIGSAAVLFPTNPGQAILRVFTAIAIHGVYNLMLTMPGLASIAAILVAFSALLTAIMTIRSAPPRSSPQNEKFTNSRFGIDKNAENQ
jgi:RsiW-degrading membrane proteinase PrsW (M82 family)